MPKKIIRLKKIYEEINQQYNEKLNENNNKINTKTNYWYNNLGILFDKFDKYINKIYDNDCLSSLSSIIENSKDDLTYTPKTIFLSKYKMV